MLEVMNPFAIATILTSHDFSFAIAAKDELNSAAGRFVYSTNTALLTYSIYSNPVLRHDTIANELSTAFIVSLNYAKLPGKSQFKSEAEVFKLENAKKINNILKSAKQFIEQVLKSCIIARQKNQPFSSIKQFQQIMQAAIRFTPFEKPQGFLDQGFCKSIFFNANNEPYPAGTQHIYYPEDNQEDRLLQAFHLTYTLDNYTKTRCSVFKRYHFDTNTAEQLAIALISEYYVITRKYELNNSETDLRYASKDPHIILIEQLSDIQRLPKAVIDLLYPGLSAELNQQFRMDFFGQRAMEFRKTTKKTSKSP